MPKKILGVHMDRIYTMNSQNRKAFAATWCVLKMAKANDNMVLFMYTAFLIFIRYLSNTIYVKLIKFIPLINDDNSTIRITMSERHEAMLYIACEF